MISFEALIISQIFAALIDFFVDPWFVKKQNRINLVKTIKIIRNYTWSGIYNGSCSKTRNILSFQ